MQLSKKRWKGLLKLLGPFLFILFFIHVVDPWKVLALLKKIRIELVLISMLLFPVIPAVLSYRWWIVCSRLKMDASLKSLYQTYYASWFIGSIPLSGVAALSKIIYLKKEGESVKTTVVSLTLDKLFDILGLMIFGLLGLFYFSGKLIEGKILWTVYGGIVLVIFMLMLLGRKTWEILKRLINRYTTNKIVKLGYGLGEDLKHFWDCFTLKLFFLITALSIGTELLRSLILYILAISLDIYVPFVLIVACSALIGIANIVPITISGLGTREAILLLALPLGGVSKEAAMALGFTAFLWTICYKFSGVVFWIKRPLPSVEINAIKEKLFP